MKRLKTFLLYALAIAGLWLLSDIVIYISVHSAYKTIESRVYTMAPEIIVGENKATYINGVTRGKIINNTDSIISNKFLKIDVYSSNDVKLGTKYIKINNLEQKANIDFEMWYKFTGANYATYTVVDSATDATQEEFLSQETATYIIVGTLLILYFI